MNGEYDVFVVYGLVLLFVLLFLLYAEIFRFYQKYRKHKDKRTLHIGFATIFVVSLCLNYFFLYLVDIGYQNGKLSIEQFNFVFDNFLGISQSDFLIIFAPIIAGRFLGPKRTFLDY